MQKVHCQKCGLYLGTSNEGDFPVQIVCPVCERLQHRVKSLFTEEYQWEEDSWFAEVMHLEVESSDVFVLLRLMTERREADFYEFPPLHRLNGRAQ